MFDGQQLGDDIVTLVRSFMEREIAPLKRENEELKARLKAVEDRPAPEVITPELPELPDFAAMIGEAVDKAVAALPKAKDGKDAANIVEAVKHEGELVLTLQDGRLIRTGIRDGKKGKDGRDGLGFEHMDAEAIDERTIALKFVRGEEAQTYELVFPVPIYRDVFKEGETYQRGDLVTWGGSLWHCDAETKEKPGTDSWTLAVKKGRDGKDAKPNG